jgi:polysaccharide pyruvyl transferase WcaK-like protein
MLRWRRLVPKQLIPGGANSQSAEVDSQLQNKNSGQCKIGLFDHMGHGNMGDAAVHESFIHNIKRRIPGVHLVAFSQNPEDTEKRHKLQSHPIRWHYPGWNEAHARVTENKRVYSASRSIFQSRYPTLYRGAKRILDVLRCVRHIIESYRVLRSLDLFVIAGGGQLCDLWPDMAYNVWKFCLLSRFARTPVVILGVGADQLRRRSSRVFTRWAIQLTTYASFRDSESQILTRSLGVKKITTVCPDPAYAIVLPENIQRQLPKMGNRRVGLNPMGYCDPRIWPRKDDTVYQRYLDKLAKFSVCLLARGYSVELFTSDIGVDKYALEDLYARLLAIVPPDSLPNVTCQTAPDVNELLTQMMSFEFVVTPKFHGIIFSNLLQKPVIGLSYLPKIKYLMRSQGLENYCLEIEGFDDDLLMSTFEMLSKNGEDIASKSQILTKMRRQLLKVEFDNVFIHLRSQFTLTRRKYRCNVL